MTDQANPAPASATAHVDHHGARRDASSDLLAVQQLLGHASPATTRAYVLVGDAARRAAVEAVAIAA